MKIGIFGGTFNPPHKGHINALDCFINSFSFDKVFVIPVFTPPHKDLYSSVSPQHRLKMSKIAFSSLGDNIEISDVEIKRQGKSYTADTIKHFKDLGYEDIYFLCGTDMLLTLDYWYKPEYILSNAKIVYIRRENDRDLNEKIENKIKLYETKFGGTVIPLYANVIEMSSTQIRDALNNKSDSEAYLTKEIISYIKENKLYNEM